MPISIPNGVHVHTCLNLVSDYPHCACELRLHDTFPSFPLQQLIVFFQASREPSEREAKRSI